MIVPRIVLVIVAVTLAAAAAFYFYWGFKIASSETVVAVEYKYQVLGLAAAISGYLLLTAGFTFSVIKKSESKAISGIYGTMLFFSLAILAGIIFGSRYVRDTAAQEFEYQCAKENITSSDIPKVDVLYVAGNA